MQFSPLRDLVNLSKKTIMTGQLLLRGGFKVKKAFLHDRLVKDGGAIIASGLDAGRNGCSGVNQQLLKETCWF